MKHFNIGQIVGVHGLKGEIVLKHALEKHSALEGVTTIFIEDKKDSFIPWFIENTRVKNESEMLIKLEGLDTKEAAKILNRKEVWLNEADFKKSAGTGTAISLLGYTIIDDKTPLAAIEEIIEQPHQILCRLTIDGKEVLIPLHQDSLKQVDHKKKTVQVVLPEGLLDLYLNS